MSGTETRIHAMDHRTGERSGEGILDLHSIEYAAVLKILDINATYVTAGGELESVRPKKGRRSRRVAQ